MRNKIFAVIALAFFALPVVALAKFPNLDGPLVSCSANPIEGSGLNECKSFCDILATSKNAVDMVLSYAVLVIAPAMLIWGGFLVAFSGDNPGNRSAGLGIIRKVVISILIIVASYVILNTFIKGIGIQTGYIQGFGDEIECNVAPMEKPSFSFINRSYAADINVNLPTPKNVNTEGLAEPIKMIVSLYKYLLSISGFLAMAVIIFGAVKYMVSSGSASGLGEAKEWIIAALSGIALLAGAYIILRTINPELTLLNLPKINKIEAPTSTIPSEGGPRPVTGGGGTGKYGYKGVAIPTGTYSDEQARAILLQAGITVNKGDCYYGQTNCTSLDGIKQEAIDGMLKIRKECPKCKLVVTGGTEEGHKSHCIGHANLDVRLDSSVGSIDNYINKDVGYTPQSYKFTKGDTGFFYYLENDHWHINFDGMMTSTNCN